MATVAARAAQQGPRIAQCASSGARRAMDAYKDRIHSTDDSQDTFRPPRDRRRAGSGRNPGGRAPTVKPSKKNVDTSRGAYAAVGQSDSRGRASAGSARDSPHTDSDLDHSASEDSELEHSDDLEKGAAPSRSRKSKTRGAAPASPSGSDDEHEGDKNKGASWHKWALIGGLVVLLLIAIAVVVYTVNHHKSSSSTATTTPTVDAAASRSSNITSATSNSTAGSTGSVAISSALSTGGGTDDAAASTLSAALVAGSPSPTGGSAAQALTTGDAGLPAQLGGATGAPAPASDTFALTADTVPTASLTAPSTSASESMGSNSVGQFSDPNSQSPDESSPSASHSTDVGATPTSRPNHEGETDWLTTTSGAGAEGSTKFSTTATWFSIDEHRTACGTTYTSNSLVAALPPALYGSDGDQVSPFCGAKMNVWSPDTNVTISVKVGDVCNACPTTTSIDLSQAAFVRLAAASPEDRDAAFDKGVLSIQWWLDDAQLQAQLPIGFSDWDGSSGETTSSR